MLYPLSYRGTFTRRVNRRSNLAPAVGLEPTTNRLTADRSTTELRGNNLVTILTSFVFGNRSLITNRDCCLKTDTNL